MIKLGMHELEKKIAAQPLLETVDGLIERFLESHDVKPVSREGYRRRLLQFARWCAYNQVVAPTRESILNYKRHLQVQNFTPLTIGAYLTAIRCFFSWAESVKLYPNIARSIKGPKRQKGFRRDPLTLKQVHDLLNSIDRSKLLGKRDYALLNLMVRTGPRTIEIIRANVDDIRTEGGSETVLWLQGKGSDSKDAFVVLTDAALRPLQEYLAARGQTREGDPLFGSTSDGNRNARMTTRSVSRIVKQRLRSIQLDSPRLSAHSCRHTTVTLALLAGASIQETQQLARHSDVSTTMIYAQNIKRAAGIPEKKIEEILSTTP
jgi:integrase/recombinase XerD